MTGIDDFTDEESEDSKKAGPFSVAGGENESGKDTKKNVSDG